MNWLYYYGLDSWYLYLLGPAILITLFAQISVKSNFSKYSKEFAHLTGAEAAKRVLEQNGVYDVRVERVSGNLTDHYDPKTNVIRLSDSVYSANTVAAVGVAAHEAGHALQYAQNYGLIKFRTAIIPICNLGSQLALPLIVIGFLLNFPIFLNVGIIFFSLAVLFQLVTLPVEFNASSRALTAIKDGNILLDDEQQKGAKNVLSAAAMTYVAALLVSLAHLLRFIFIANRRRR